jgi:hypothetical protein
MTLTSCLHFSFPKRHPKPISNTRTDIQTSRNQFGDHCQGRGEDAACAITGFRDWLRTPDSTGFQCGVRAEDQFLDTEVASGEVSFELVVAGYMMSRALIGVSLRFFVKNLVFLVDSWDPICSELSFWKQSDIGSSKCIRRFCCCCCCILTSLASLRVRMRFLGFGLSSGTQLGSEYVK